MSHAIATPPAHPLILDEDASPETQALAQALAGDLSPTQAAALQKVLDHLSSDLYRGTDARAQADRARFLVHLARAPEVIWGHVHQGRDPLTCPVCADELRA